MQRRGYRQEVFNVLLAQLLREREIISAPEDVLATAEGRRMPDVLVDFAGLRTAIEGEVADQPDANEKALSSARGRVEEGIAQIALAVVYPAELRQKDFPTLKADLSKANLKVAVVTEAGPSGFADANVDGLAEILRNTFDQLVQENVVAQAAALLESGIEKFAAAVAGSDAILSRMAEALGVRELPKEDKNPGDDNDQGEEEE